MALAGALDVLFVSPTRVLAITAGGALVRSDDGGAHFTPVALRDEIPLSLGLADERLVIATTRRRATLDAAGALVDAADAPSYAAFVRGASPDRAPARALVLPDDPSRVAPLADGTLAVVDGDVLRVHDPVRGVVLRSVATPAQACSPLPAHGSYRLRCTHDGWAGVVYAPTPDGGWRTLRDELRAEPMGAMVFDDASDAWAVSAPCQQRPQADPTAMCVYLPDGSAHAVFAPFAATLVDMHGGVAAAVATEGADALTRGALVRGESMTVVSVPAGPAAARAMRFCDGALSLWTRATGAWCCFGLMRAETAWPRGDARRLRPRPRWGSSRATRRTRSGATRARRGDGSRRAASRGCPRRCRATPARSRSTRRR